MKENGRVEHLLWSLYPNEDCFIRQRPFSVSAECVVQRQGGPPWHTRVIAETATLGELEQRLRELHGLPYPPEPIL